jgi:hypothetical protein
MIRLVDRSRHQLITGHLNLTYNFQFRTKIQWNGVDNVLADSIGDAGTDGGWLAGSSQHQGRRPLGALRTGARTRGAASSYGPDDLRGGSAAAPTAVAEAWSPDWDFGLQEGRDGFAAWRGAGHRALATRAGRQQGGQAAGGGPAAAHRAP